MQARAPAAAARGHRARAAPLARPARLARLAPLALAACLLAPALAAAGPRDPLYRWTDEAGDVRYTSEPARIPAALRDGAVRVELPPEGDPTAAPPAADAVVDPATRPPASGPGEALPPVEAPGSDAEPAAAAPTPLDRRIAELERAIAADEGALAEHISDPERAAHLHDSEEVATIAERLPRLQEELRALRALRDGAGASDAP